jgi:hypothetical protein
VRRELALSRNERDETWIRAALALCDLYQGADAQRFGHILTQLANGSIGSATAEAARWLLTQWQAALEPK